jgi:hypothetical protein
VTDWRRMRRLLLLACVLLAGCGNEQAKPPDMAVPASPAGSTPVSFAPAGIRLAAPGGWKVQPGQAPLVATIQSGTAQIAIWRYPRTEPLPKTTAQLTQARDLLVQAAKARDQTFKKSEATITKVGGHPAIQVRGTETLAGQPRTVRSTHVYAFGGEVVVDAFAPATVFGQVDRDAFRPVVKSLRLQAP